MKVKETLVQKVQRESKLKELSAEADTLIVNIVKSVEEINKLKSIPSVTVGKRHFDESHEVLKEIGYDDTFGIVKFRIPLNKISWFDKIWNPNLELEHEFYWDWRIRSYTRPNLNATVQMYENLITRLELMLVCLEKEKNILREIK